MNTIKAPGVFSTSKNVKSDAEREREVRAHYDAHPGVRFLVDVLTALHASPQPVRTASAFYKKFPAAVVMQALESRPDLRAIVVQALTAGPPSLTRRMSPAVITAQIELLIETDILVEERVIRAEEDRGRSVAELYLKYLNPIDLAAYLPPVELWAYEKEGSWWDRATDATRRLMAAEIKSIRRHKILSDTDLLDAIGDDVLERDLAPTVRTAMRGAMRRAARDKKHFTDTDVFDCVRTPDGERDLVDSLVESVPLPHLRVAIGRAAQVLALEAASLPVPSPVPAPAETDAADVEHEFSLMESLVPPSGEAGGDDAFG
jgi:hypothetical protein